MDQVTPPLKPSILIAPLDWGLGHATRCIPIIKTLLSKNCLVSIAAQGKTKVLLQQEFPQLKFIESKGYNIRYSKNNWSLPFVIARQIPKILSAIQYEHEHLKEIVTEHRIDGIISDNRFGFYHASVPSVFITHQLLIKTPFGRKINAFVQKWNYRYINHFSECWIPDYEEVNNLAGELSHPLKKPSIPITFIGALSRLKKMNLPPKHVVIILSGPEPQRTIFENLLMHQIKNYRGSIVLVRGLPGEAFELKSSANISVYNHLCSEELNKKMEEASVVIARCGYSTIMDLAVMKKKSILIPTPGQTEQEYLAEHALKNRFALCISQNQFQFENALELSSLFDYACHNFDDNNLKTAVDNFLHTVHYHSSV